MLQTVTDGSSPQMPTLFFGLCAFTIVCSVVLGGGTRGGFLSDGILQFLSLPLLLVSLWRLFDLQSATSADNKRPIRRELVFCGAIVLVPLLQLVPLPPWIWSALPGRKPEAHVFELLGGGMPWMPISVSPEATWLSLLSLIPPMAVVLGCLLLGYRERRLMSLVVLAVGLVSVFLGLVQVSQGPLSSLRFFEFTNPTEAVGFFANRNHLAALLYALTLLAAAWAIDAAFTAQSDGSRNRSDGPAIVALVASFTVLLVLVSAQAMARSRAGLGLTMLAVFGALALAYADRRAVRGKDRRRVSGITPTKVLLGATALAILFSVQFTLYRVMERFVAIDPMEDTRTLIARSTIEAATAFMPFGSGMGTFVPVYAMFERSQDALINAYVNHAHDDILELWLETGVIGIVMMGVFLVWLVLRSREVWRRGPYGESEIDHTLARAATLIIGLLIVHSFLDYPLRTDAMMAIMAFACALLIKPPSCDESDLELEVSRRAEKVMRRAARQPELAAAVPRPKVSARAATPVTISPRQPAELLGENMDWPEEWRKPVKHVSPNISAGTFKTEKPRGE
jgi:O-antigen ligase